MPTQRSAIDLLAPETQDQIITWLETESRRKVLERIAQPPPDGLGLKTHLTTLNRFYARHLAKDRAADRDVAQLFAPKSSSDPVVGATKSVAADWAFQLATSPRRNLARFKAIARWVLKQREIEQRERDARLVEQRLAFDRERWEFDLARQLLEHHAELYEIRREPDITDEEKINRARAMLFGTAPDPAPLGNEPQ